MAHIKHSTTSKSASTPPEWLGVGRQIGVLANEISGRSDLIAFVGAGAGGDYAACYNPSLSEIEVNVAVAFGKAATPESVGDLTRRDRQYEFPRAMGAIFHEAFHAKFSQWSLDSAQATLRPDEFLAFMLLEESRIEAQGLLYTPRCKPFLRASAIDLIVSEADERFAAMGDTEAAAKLVALVHARIDAGVLDESETESLRMLVDSKLGEDVVTRLRSLARRAQSYTSLYDPEPMYEWAREWARIVKETAEANGDARGSGAEAMAGAIAEAVGEGGSEFAEAMGALLDEMLSEIEIANNDTLADQQTNERWKEESKERAQEAKKREQSTKTAKEVFSPRGAEEGYARSHSRIREKRAPNAAERAAAVTVATMLDKAKYRERDVTEIASEVPPGRLRTRALVQSQAMKSRGVMTQAQPWRRSVRKHTDDPTLSIGVAVDISGSMRAADEPMATTAWVLSEAARRIQARCAMVYFGNDVFPTLRVGQHLDEVTVYSASDGTEKFDKAMDALNGSLNLVDGAGARLLVVVSDGHYTGPESQSAIEWMRRCRDAGVAVLWMTFSEVSGSSSYVGTHLLRGNGEVLDGALDPTTAASEIGRAAARALTDISSRAA